MNTKIANVIKRKFFINQYRNLGFNIISSEAMFIHSLINYYFFIVNFVSLEFH